MKYLYLIFIPLLVGFPIMLFFGFDFSTNAAGINDSLFINILMLSGIFVIFSFKKIACTRSLFWFFILPLTSIMYAKDLFLSNEMYLYYMFYLFLYVIFRHYSFPILFYKTLVVYSLVLMLYVLYQNIYAFPMILHTHADSAVKALLGSGRQFATFQLPNAYAAFCITAFFIALYLYKKEHKFYYFIIALCNLGMMLLTKTFIAFGLMVLYTVIILITKKRYKQLIIGSLLVLIAGIMFFSVREFSSVEKSLQERYQNYSSAIQMYSDNSLIGVGENNFDLHYPRYQQQDANVIHNAHSFALQSMADHGVVGIIMVVFFGIALYRIRASPLFPMFVVLSCYFMIDIVYYFPSIGGLFWLLYAINEPDEQITYGRRTFAWVAILLYVSVAILFIKIPPKRYLRMLADERKELHDKGLYYSAWLKTIELEEYRYNDK